MGEEKKGFKLPHIYVLLVSIILICAAASWVVPAGEFERVKNAAGRTVVVANSYHVIESTPVGLFAAVKAVYAGLVDAASVIFFIFVAYASIGILLATGAFNGLVSALLKKFRGKSRALIIPIFMLIMGAASSTIGVFEEALPFIPIFVGIAIAMGYDAIVGMAIIGLGVGLGYSGAAIKRNVAEISSKYQPHSLQPYTISTRVTTNAESTSFSRMPKGCFAKASSLMANLLKSSPYTRLFVGSV
ncbi:hypothetical protein AGMMS49957_13430 [Synergistales bacterium]|nr:hypothetical protein AGMMS49957_13430 [Synergistales bacterium]